RFTELFYSEPVPFKHLNGDERGGNNYRLIQWDSNDVQSPHVFLFSQTNKLVKYLSVKNQTKIPIRHSGRIIPTLLPEISCPFPSLPYSGVTIYFIVPHSLICPPLPSLHSAMAGISYLLMVILSVIFMNGNKASEAVIWEVLHKLELRPGYDWALSLSKFHFLSPRYLEYKRVPNSRLPQYEFFWGLRSYHEASKMKVLKFAVQKKDPKDWPAQYWQAVEMEAQAATVAEAEAEARAEIRVYFPGLQIMLMNCSGSSHGAKGHPWNLCPYSGISRYYQSAEGDTL
uniref:MAGE domain-containing protein n=1 Tax=Suricata suricatta TaxID=37032 RepID=A0A673VBU7_SURSU